MKVIISNIQRFSLHDGPGIRTTVFFKGCNLYCPWCSNPENINFNIEQYKENNEKKYFGYEISLEDLEKEVLKDKKFYETGGGVTFSGGECLLQFKKIEPLLKNLKKRNINICVETSLNVSNEFVDLAIKYVDYFYIDIKILDSETQYLIGANCKNYIENVNKVLNNNKNVIFRIPLIKGYTYTVNNINIILDFIKKHKVKGIELFKIHNLGEYKYKLLNKNVTKFDKISDKELNSLKNKISKLNTNVKIIELK